MSIDIKACKLCGIRERKYNNLVRQLDVYKNNRYAAEKVIVVHQKMLRLMKELECFMDKDGGIDYEVTLKDSFYRSMDDHDSYRIATTPETYQELIEAKNNSDKLSNTIETLKEEKEELLGANSKLQMFIRDIQKTSLAKEDEILRLKLLLDKNNIAHD